MRVLFVTSEIAPWVKTGGLGDVAGALPAALAGAGCDVRVLVPDYPALAAAFPTRGAPVGLPAQAPGLPSSVLTVASATPGLSLLLLCAPGLYDRPGNPYLGPDGHDWHDNALRFGLLARVAALLAAGATPLDWVPDVIHCNDWQTALAPAFLRYLHDGAGAASVVSIHNLAFLGLFDPRTLRQIGLPEHAFALDGVEFHGHVCYLKAGLQSCDRIATVSPTYAREILEPEFGNGLDGLLRHRSDRLSGILNGIDTALWNPAADPAIARNYDADSLDRKRENRRDLQHRLGLTVQDDHPVIGVVSRLTEQKGLDLLLEVADGLCDRGVQFAVLGSGEPWLQAGWQALAARHPERCSVTIGFDETLAHRIEAGADLFAMPSRFEPCGLNQMYSLRYGTPPVVRRTGGLADTVTDATPGGKGGNGFVFEAPTAAALSSAIERALALWADCRAWRRVQRAGMHCDHGWAPAARAYRQLYEAALDDRARRAGG